MGRLAKALAFVCGPDHPTTIAFVHVDKVGARGRFKASHGALYAATDEADSQALSPNKRLAVWATLAAHVIVRVAISDGRICDGRAALDNLLNARRWRDRGIGWLTILFPTLPYRDR
jgi:hypothetical protein